MNRDIKQWYQSPPQCAWSKTSAGRRELNRRTAQVSGRRAGMSGLVAAAIEVDQSARIKASPNIKRPVVIRRVRSSDIKTG
jgi:hypothetical protein